MRKVAFFCSSTFLLGLLTTALSLQLGGCQMVDNAVLWPQVEHANNQMAAAKADCDNKFPPMPGSYLAHAQCIDAAQDWIIRPLSPYPDLLARSHSVRERLAAKVDAGLMAPDDYARLTEPEDTPLSVADATRNGPVSRNVHGNYIALPPDRQNNRCSTGYDFSGC